MDIGGLRVVALTPSERLPMYCFSSVPQSSYSTYLAVKKGYSHCDDLSGRQGMYTHVAVTLVSLRDWLSKALIG